MDDELLNRHWGNIYGLVDQLMLTHEFGVHSGNPLVVAFTDSLSS